MPIEEETLVSGIPTKVQVSRQNTGVESKIDSRIQSSLEESTAPKKIELYDPENEVPEITNDGASPIVRQTNVVSSDKKKNTSQQRSIATTLKGEILNEKVLMELIARRTAV